MDEIDWIPQEGDRVNYTLTGETVYTVNTVDRRLDSNLNETYFCSLIRISDKGKESFHNINYKSLKYVSSEQPTI